MVRPFRSVVAVCFVALVAASGIPAASATPTSANECVGFSLTRSDPDIEYVLENGCEQPLSCTVTWTLSCGEEGKATRQPGRRAVAVAPATTANVTVSAASCRAEEWRIEDVSWACQRR